MGKLPVCPNIVSARRGAQVIILRAQFINDLNMPVNESRRLEKVQGREGVVDR